MLNLDKNPLIIIVICLGGLIEQETLEKHIRNINSQ